MAAHGPWPSGAEPTRHALPTGQPAPPHHSAYPSEPRSRHSGASRAEHLRALHIHRPAPTSRVTPLRHAAVGNPLTRRGPSLNEPQLPSSRPRSSSKTSSPAYTCRRAAGTTAAREFGFVQPIFRPANATRRLVRTHSSAIAQNRHPAFMAFMNSSLVHICCRIHNRQPCQSRWSRTSVSGSDLRPAYCLPFSSNVKC